MCDVVVLKESEQKSYLQLFKFCTFVTPTPSVLSHIATSCAGECGLSVLAALNTMFPARALKGSGWVAAIFSTHIASLPCSDLNDSSVWEWKKGFVSPLDELPITTGPTAVVTHCVSMCQGVCVLCAHTVMKLHRVPVRIVVSEVEKIVSIVLFSTSYPSVCDVQLLYSQCQGRWHLQANIYSHKMKLFRIQSHMSSYWRDVVL